MEDARKTQFDMKEMEIKITIFKKLQIVDLSSTEDSDRIRDLFSLVFFTSVCQSTKSVSTESS